MRSHQEFVWVYISILSPTEFSNLLVRKFYKAVDISKVYVPVRFVTLRRWVNLCCDKLL